MKFMGKNKTKIKFSKFKEKKKTKLGKNSLT